MAALSVSRPTALVLRDTVGLRLALGLGAVLVAYHYSLLTLVRDLGLDTPLAYLGLAPIIAVGIAVLLPDRASPSPDIHDRQLDLIVGVPLVLGTVVALHVLPQRLSTLFWTWRIDLLTLPVFVFGVVVLLFGLRTAWRFHTPIAFLFLAWPLPYTVVIDRSLQVTTDTTISAIKSSLHVFAVAVPSATGDGSVFTIAPHGGTAFPVSIASACAGVNSLVGFVIVGLAFLSVTRPNPARPGRRQSRGVVRRLLWLAFGLVLVWALNVVRLMIVLWAGREWGKTVAIDGLHPVIGLFTFSAAVIVALLVMPFFGLRVPPRRAPLDPEPRLRRLGTAAGRRPTSARGLRIAAVTVLAAAGVLVGQNSSFAHYELVAGDLTSARLAGFAEQPAPIPGFSSSKIDSYDWITQFFGSGSVWNRFQYNANGLAGGPLATSFSGRPIIADAIEGRSLGSFNAYGIEACYKFHGYDTGKQRRVDLGSGVYGGSISFHDPRQAVTWNVVYWVWPVETPKGKRYERVTLLQQNDAATGVAASPNDSPFQGVGVAAPLGVSGPVQEHNLQLLVDFAKSVISHQAAAPVASTTTT